MAISLASELAYSLNTSGSTLSGTFQPSGTGLALIVSGYCADGGSLTGLKFAGTALTRIQTNIVASDERVELWYLSDPPTSKGTLNGTWSLANLDKAFEIACYNGVDPTIFDVTAGGTKSGSVVNGTITTLTDNSWVIFTHTKNDISQTMSSATGWNERLDSDSPNVFSMFYADNGPISSAGLITYVGTNTSIGMTGRYAWSMVALVPTIVGAVTIPTYRNLSGVGL